MDVLNIESYDFLITAAHPLNLTIISMVDTIDAITLSHNLTDHIALLRAERYDVSKIIADRASAFGVLVGKYSGIAIRLGGAGDHVPRADERCKAIKQIYRSVRSDLPWDLPKSLVKDLAAYCAHRLKMQKGRNAETTQKIEITGLKPHYDNEYGLKFGDYAEVKDPSVKSNNATLPRSRSCIALYPAGNRQGSWHFFNMETKHQVTSSNWNKLKTSEIVINRMNAIAKAEINPKLKKIESETGSMKPNKHSASEGPKKQVAFDLPDPPRKEEVKLMPSAKEEVDQTKSVAPPCNIKSVVSCADSESVTPFVQRDPYPIELINAHNQIQYESIDSLIPPAPAPSSVAKGPNVPSAPLLPSEQLPQLTAIEPLAPFATIINSTPSTAVDPPRVPMGGRYENRERHPTKRFGDNAIPQADGGHSFMPLARGLSLFNNAAKLAAEKELKQLVSKNVWKYVKNSNRAPVMWSQMIISEKTDPAGNLIKIKGRMVANGKTQILQPFQNTSSPTISSPAIFSLLKISAIENRYQWTIDIFGAYLNADMDVDTYMIISKQCTDLLKNIDPTCVPFIRSDGTLLVQLQKALYGCKQSGLLWNERLTKFLLSIGFIQNPCDPCVFNLNCNGDQFSIGHILTMVYKHRLIWIICVGFETN